MTKSDPGERSPAQRGSVLTPEGQIEQAGRFARGLRRMDSRRKRLLLTVLLVVILPSVAVLVIAGIAWLIDVS